MEQFVTINNIIINKNQIKTIHVEKDVEQTCDYDGYTSDVDPDGLRAIDIYLIIETLEDTKEFTILDDDDYHDFISFIQDFYCTDYDHAIKQAANLVKKATIRKYN